MPTPRAAFALAMLALCLSGLGCATSDAAHRTRALPQGEPIAAGVPYESDAGFSLLPGSGWARVPSGTVGDTSSTLELHDEMTGSFVIFYVHGSAATLDALVANRRAALAQSGDVKEFQEERHFSSRAALVPVSTAHYRVRSDVERRLMVVTAHGSERTVEAVGLMQRNVASELRMKALLESLVP
jgi:hypothetical protein